MKKFIKSKWMKVCGFMTLCMCSLGLMASAAGEPSVGTSSDAVDGMKSVLSGVTETLNISTIVTVIAVVIGLAAALFFFWWGSRYVVRKIRAAFSKGKVGV